MWGYMQPYHGGWGWFGGPGTMILLWGLLIGCLVVLFSMFSRGRHEHKRVDPIDILKERYARGEIDREEFEARKRDLMAP